MYMYMSVRIATLTCVRLTQGVMRGAFFLPQGVSFGVGYLYVGHALSAQMEATSFAYSAPELSNTLNVTCQSFGYFKRNADHLGLNATDLQQSLPAGLPSDWACQPTSRQYFVALVWCARR